MRLLGMILVLVVCQVVEAKPRRFVAGPFLDGAIAVTERGVLDATGDRLFVATRDGIRAHRVSTGEQVWSTTAAQVPLAVLPEGVVALRTQVVAETSWRGEARAIFVPWRGEPVEGDTIRATGSISQLVELRVERGVLRATLIGLTPSGIAIPEKIPQDIGIELATGERLAYGIASGPVRLVRNPPERPRPSISGGELRVPPQVVSPQGVPRPFVSGPIDDQAPILSWFGLLDPLEQRFYVPSQKGIDVLDVRTGERSLATDQAQLPLAIVAGGLLAVRGAPMEITAWHGDAELVFVPPNGAPRVGGKLPRLGSFTVLSDLTIRDGRLHAIALGQTPSGVDRPGQLPVPIEIELRAFEVRVHAPPPFRPAIKRTVQTAWGWFSIESRAVPGTARFSAVVERQVGSAPLETTWLGPRFGAGAADLNATAIALTTETSWQVIDPRTLKLVHAMRRLDLGRYHPLHVVRAAGLLLIHLGGEEGPNEIVALDEKTGVERWRYAMTRRFGSVAMRMMIQP